MGELLKCVTNLGLVAIGPFASDKVPAMAPDIRPWAFWVSGIAAVGAIVSATSLLSGLEPDARRRRAKRYTVVGAALAFVSAFAYYVINLLWTTDTGTFVDVVWQVAIVAVYSLGSAGIAIAGSAAQKLTTEKKSE